MKVVLTGNIYQKGVACLEEIAEVVQLPAPEPEAKLDALKDADGVIVRTDPLDRSFLDSAANLKAIGRFGVGYDNIDVKAATERGIAVVYAPGVNATAVAEHTMALILALAKRLNFWRGALTSGKWHLRLEVRSFDLKGKVLGIVGFGNIGRKVAKFAEAFELDVIAYDPFISDEAARGAGVKSVCADIDDLLRQADFISLHLPLNDDTRGLINNERLSLVKDGAMLINTARGPIIDLDAASRALEHGKLSGVALDVYPEEPPDLEHPIFKHPSFIGSPHVASHTGALDEMGLVVAQCLRDVLQGKRPKFIVNPEVLDR